MNRWHVHPDNPNQCVWGEKLKPSQTICAGDVCDCPRGVWEVADSCFIGSTISPDSHTYWVRPAVAQVSV